MFMVVEFLEDKTVAIVPECWVEQEENVLYTFWPPIRPTALARRMEYPDKKKWARYKIRMFENSASEHYDEALKKLKKSESTSCVETDEESYKRPIVPPRRFLDDESPYTDITIEVEDNSDCEMLASEKKRYDNKKITQQFKAGKRVHSGRLLDEESYNTDGHHSVEDHFEDEISVKKKRLEPKKMAQQSISGNSESQLHKPQTWNNGKEQGTPFTPNEQRTLKPDSANFRLSILMKLDTIIENQKAQTDMLRTVLTAMTKVSAEADMEDILPQPMQSVPEMERLCARLDHKESGKEFKRKLGLYLASIGGKNIADCIRRIMRAIATNAVWCKYTVKGTEGKRSLKNLAVYNLMIKSYLLGHPHATAAEVTTEIMEVLRFAPYRDGGDKYKKATIKSSPQLTAAVWIDSDTDSDL